jgi:nitrogen fixation protein NifQ
MKSGRGRDPFDRHVFACVLTLGLEQNDLPLWDFVGLSPAILRLLLAAYFPEAGIAVPGHARQAAEAIEEADFRLLLLSYRARHVPEEDWLAAIIARRAQAPNHLWEDLGLCCRDELNELIRRHFTGLSDLNDKKMRWKKFFYRLMCEAEGLRLCKSPNCEQCCDIVHCFEAESPLIGMANWQATHSNELDALTVAQRVG